MIGATAVIVVFFCLGSVGAPASPAARVSSSRQPWSERGGCLPFPQIDPKILDLRRKVNVKTLRALGFIAAEYEKFIWNKNLSQSPFQSLTYSPHPPLWAFPLPLVRSLIPSRSISIPFFAADAPMDLAPMAEYEAQNPTYFTTVANYDG